MFRLKCAFSGRNLRWRCHMSFSAGGEPVSQGANSNMRHFKLIRLNSEKSTSPSADRAPLVDCTDSTVQRPTPRELEVEELLCRGYSQENIAAIFNRSIHTISVH